MTHPAQPLRRLLAATSLAVATGLLAPAFGQASLEERLQRLEQQMSALQKENAQLRSELGLEGRAGQTIVKPAGREPTLSVGGLLQVQSDLGDKGDARFTSGNDRVYLRRARLNLQGRFLEEFDFKIEGEFAGSLAEATGNRAQLTDAYLNWNRYDFANIKVGQFKTPFGYEQLYADPRLLTIERTLVNDRLTASRQLGVQVAGDLLDKRLSYATGLFNGTGVNTSANDNDKFMWAGRISGVAWQGPLLGQDTRWSLGADALADADSNLPSQPSEFGFDLVPGGTKDAIFAGRRQAGGLDTQFHSGPFDLWVEYLRERFKPLDAIPSAAFDSAGWYAQAGWFVVPKELQGVVKFDTFDPNLGVVSNSTKTWTFGVNYFLKGDDIKLQGDYLLTDIDGQPAQNRKLILRLQTIF
ncbi:MAG TPA: porin [Opitutaceae bacterium]|nr:porin [Opitutaceae bacterium]